MSYEPTNWKTGDVVTSAKLNKLEQGVAGGGVLKVTLNTGTSALDKTWQEIYDAVLAVMLIPMNYEGHDIHYDVYFSSAIFTEENRFVVKFVNIEGNEYTFASDSADGVLVVRS